MLSTVVYLAINHQWPQFEQSVAGGEDFIAWDVLSG